MLRLMNWSGAVGMSLLLAMAATWFAAIHDYPVDEAIVAGMTSPECRAISRIPAGSVLFATLPDSDICRSYFLYRSTQPYAANDAPSYVNLVMQSRVAEFWRLIVYVLMLWVFAIAVVLGGVCMIRRFFTRHWRNS